MNVDKAKAVDDVFNDLSMTDTKLVEYLIEELAIRPVEACRVVMNRNTLDMKNNLRLVLRNQSCE